MSNLSTTGMDFSRGHYPPHVDATTGVPYRQAVSTAAQDSRLALIFEYQIGYRFRRQHFNPPIWTQAHYHSFDATVFLESFQGSGDMFGIDMVEYESRLQQWVDRLPDCVNEMGEIDCNLGTTEALCRYIAKLPVESHVRVSKVCVSETPTRVTSLIIPHD